MVTSEPTPMVQAAVYMFGILAGYLLLTRPEEWARARTTVRQALTRRRTRD